MVVVNDWRWVTLEVRGRLGLRGFQRLERGSLGLVVGHGGSMEELAAEMASMIEGNELEGSAIEFHLRQLK